MAGSSGKRKQPQIRATPPERNSRIELSAPWGGGQAVCNVMPIDDTTLYDDFLRERTRLHEVYIRQEATNKRIGLILAFLLILASAVVVLFAPEGRETMSYWVGAALIVFAAGAVGFGRIWAKASQISFGADGDKRPI